MKCKCVPALAAVALVGPQGVFSGLMIEMLSIGKLATGQERYYLDQAKSRVDRVSSVSSGIEDYYVQGAEPDGVWIGAGRSAVGVDGAVTAAQLRRLLDGCH